MRVGVRGVCFGTMGFFVLLCRPCSYLGQTGLVPVAVEASAYDQVWETVLRKSSSGPFNHVILMPGLSILSVNLDTGDNNLHKLLLELKNVSNLGMAISNFRMPHVD